jgi:hypothetical protein
MPEPYLVFLSHVNDDASLASTVADQLEAQGLSAFAAGRDIPKSAQWLPTIESAVLRSDALAAFLSPTFSLSEWTDMEVGYALGRRRKVLPLRRSADIVPHGFLRRYQAIDIGGLAAEAVASLIVDSLLQYDDEKHRFAWLVAQQLLTSRSAAVLRLWVRRLAGFKSMPPEDLNVLIEASRSNSVLRSLKDADRAVRESLRRLSGGGLA